MHTCSEVISAGNGQVSVLTRDWGESREAAGTASHTATEKELTCSKVQNGTNFPLDFCCVNMCMEIHVYNNVIIDSNYMTYIRIPTITFNKNKNKSDHQWNLR